MTDCTYEIRSAWPGRKEDPAEIGRKFLATLDALTEADPAFANWGTSDVDETPRGQPIAPLRTDFTSWVEANVERDDWGKAWPQLGYSVWAASGYRPFAPLDPKSVSFYLTAGSEQSNRNCFEAGRYGKAPDPSIVTYPGFKSALLTMISIWPAPWANARAIVWSEESPASPGEPSFPKSSYTMAWMSYLCAERAAKLSVPDTVLAERTPDGGLLMIAAEARFDPWNPEHRARSRIMTEIMREHGGNPFW
ncbi:Imm52 family immunity protein [Phenylobacterium montanum]|uniref:Immunity 52 family protein n=1 Tax=Phenylobacterium montanum TaxID=2823693 RepID=A0A975IX37_9CAUL|nr:Imm52 family immunity protein [Caulobacter sp. S6]QUD90543.1 immunity 52 family protein [Caulobacter sp. S6]